MPSRWLTALIVAAFALVAGCAGPSPAPVPSPDPSPRGELPPAWVQNETAWQAWPRAMRTSVSWVLTRIAHAAGLDPPRPTSEAIRYRVTTWPTSCSCGATRRPRATTLYFVLRTNYHDFLAHGRVPSARLDLSGLPAMHRLRARAARQHHCLGPYDGRRWRLPRRLRRSRMPQWPSTTNRRQRGVPVARVRSNADGFFTLMPPGSYVFTMTRSDHAFSTIGRSGGKRHSCGGRHLQEQF